VTLTNNRDDQTDCNDHPLEEGAIVGGKFHIERALGRGAFAWVYLARHVEIPSLKLAVKVLRRHVAFDSDIRERFRAEALLAAQLQSPHVVRITDYGSPEGEAPYIVMEFIDGETLSQRIQRHGPVRHQDVARLGIHIAHALAEAHGAGIVHRDLKPSNIYLSEPQRGTDFTAKVLDFGIAKVLTGLAAADIVAFQTASLSINCTPRYAAPELLRGNPSAQSDIYALGITMLEALNGRPPYTSDNTFEVAAQHLADMPVPLGAAEGMQLAPILRKACAKDPDERYLSARQLLDDLLGMFHETGRSRDRNYQSDQSMVVREETDERPAVPREVPSISVLATPPVGFQAAGYHAGLAREQTSYATALVPAGTYDEAPHLMSRIVPLIVAALLLTSAAGLRVVHYRQSPADPTAETTSADSPQEASATARDEIFQAAAPALDRAANEASTTGRELGLERIVLATETIEALEANEHVLAAAHPGEGQSSESGENDRRSERSNDRRRDSDNRLERDQPNPSPTFVSDEPPLTEALGEEAALPIPQLVEPLVEEPPAQEAEENPFDGLNTMGR
jgi:serine/threonine protein kinase